jgi:hypothetical protein
MTAQMLSNKMVLAVFLLPFVLGALTDCNTSSVLRPSYLAASPEVPVYDKNVTFTVQLDAGYPNFEAFHNATLTLLTSYNGWPVLNSTAPLEPNMTYFQNASWIYKFTWPTRLSGSYITKAELKVEDETYLCLQHNVTIPWF